MLQIRNLPVSLHRQLKARAALEGLSMSEYALREIRQAIEVPPRGEILERLRSQPRPGLKPSPAELIRAERDAR